MKWLDRLLSCFWLSPMDRRRAYVKAYKNHVERATKAAVIIREDARKHKFLVMETAETKAAEISAKARDEGLKAGRAKAVRENQTIESAARTRGLDEGRLAAYCAYARQYNLTLPTTAAEIPAYNLNDIDIQRVYPNVYLSPGKWIVRVLVNDELRGQYFRFKSVLDDTVRHALVAALCYRDSLVPLAGSHNSALHAECLQQAMREQAAGTPTSISLRTRELFHLRVMQAGAQIERVGWVGQDPEDRFATTDPAVLTMPWPTLFSKTPKRIIEAFQAVGLDTNRTVRDLLMLTADELWNVDGFGEVSLRKLRAGLREYGLALWGDPVPAAPRVPLTTGEREFRAINLD